RRAAAARRRRDVDGAQPRGPHAVRRSHAAGRRVAGSRRAPGAAAQQTAAARNARAAAAARGGRPSQAGLHAAVRALDRRRARAVRARRHGVARRRRLDRAAIPGHRVVGVAARRRALEPAVGARHPGPVAAADADGRPRTMNRLLSRIRRAAGATRRRLAPSPEVAAWRRACRLAERTPRYTHGEIELGPYTLQYSDLLTLCPQWDDIFVRRSLAFTTPAQAPRILDCGANLGLASLFFKRAYPAARITAFEADPAIARMLAANLRRNGAADVEVV